MVVTESQEPQQPHHRSVADMGAKYKHGVPELGLPSLDPMLMPRIELNIGANKVKMENIRSTGLSITSTRLFSNISCRNEQDQCYIRFLRQELKLHQHEDAF